MIVTFVSNGSFDFTTAEAILDSSRTSVSYNGTYLLICGDVTVDNFYVLDGSIVGISEQSLIIYIGFINIQTTDGLVVAIIGTIECLVIITDGSMLLSKGDVCRLLIVTILTGTRVHDTS